MHNMCVSVWCQSSATYDGSIERIRTMRQVIWQATYVQCACTHAARRRVFVFGGHGARMYLGGKMILFQI